MKVRVAQIKAISYHPVLCVCVWVCFKFLLTVPCVPAASSHVGLDDFVEMTKKYAQGVAPPPVMAAAGDDDDDDVVVKNPDELPLQQKVGGGVFARPLESHWVESHWITVVSSHISVLPPAAQVPSARPAGDQGAPH